MTRTQRLFGRCFLGALAAVFLLVNPGLMPPASAGDGIEVGADAPDFDSDGTFNTEPLKLSDLRGRLILLEFFKTT